MPMRTIIFNTRYCNIIFCIYCLLNISLTSAGTHAAPMSPPIIVIGKRQIVDPSQTKWRKKDLEEKQYYHVQDALQTTPGVSFSNGPYQRATSLYVRGAEAQHTYVVLDDIIMNDASAPSYLLDMAQLDMSNVATMSLLRGSADTQSTESGLVGTLSMTTEQGKGPTTVFNRLEAGSFDSSTQDIGIKGQKGRIDYYVHGLNESSNGIVLTPSDQQSMTRQKQTNPMFKQNLHTRFGLALTEQSHIHIVNHIMHDDYYYVQPFDQENPAYESIRLQQGHKIEYRIDESSWTSRLGTTYYKQKRTEQKEDQTYTKSPQGGIFEGQSLAFFWKNTRNFNAIYQMTLDMKWTQNHCSNQTSYGTINAKQDQGILLNGHRLTFFNHTRPVILDGSLIGTVFPKTPHPSTLSYKGKITWSMMPTTDVIAAIGTSFSPPSLYQYYDPFYGNQNLKAERLKSYDIGIIHSFLNRSYTASIIYFHHDYDHLIEFSNDHYSNVRKAHVHGIESSLRARFKNTSIILGYTFLHTKNEQTGFALYNRPMHQGSFDLLIHPIDHWLFGGGIIFLGHMINADPLTLSPKSHKVPCISRLFFEYTLPENSDVKIYGRLENVTNQNYQMPLGRMGAGFSCFLGIKIKNNWK